MPRSGEGQIVRGSDGAPPCHPLPPAPLLVNKGERVSLTRSTSSLLPPNPALLFPVKKDIAAYEWVLGCAPHWCCR